MLLRNLYLVQKKIEKREKISDAKYLEEKKMQDQIESSDRKRWVHLNTHLLEFPCAQKTYMQ